MRRATLLLLLAAACTPVPPVPPPSVAVLPAGTYPDAADQDLAAIGVAADAFADAARTYGQPVQAARAAAALDYLAGEVNVAPRWECASSQSRQQLLDARTALRAALGVPDAASSQLVVDDLLRAAAALQDNDPDAARQALASVFPDPAGTLDRLGHLPYLQAADVAAQALSAEVNQAVPGSTCFAG